MEIKSGFSVSAAGKGFTLIELMIVVAIIGILSAVAVPRFTDLIRKSHEGASKGKLSGLRSTLHIYYADNEGTYPTDDLSSLLEAGKYISYIPEVYIPGYHVKNSGVQNNDDLGTAAILTDDSGGWLYWNQRTGSASRQWGGLWIGCNHEDAAGNVWSSL
jgi:prepilin-type N-terminal cleavage/methylation domain-containing protein